MVALSCFISRIGDRSLPFFKALRKHDNFKWTQEAQETFDDLKRYLSSAPLLTTLKPSEALLLYLAASPQAQRRARARTRKVPAANLLHQRGPAWAQGMLHQGPEAHVSLFMASRKL